MNIYFFVFLLSTLLVCIFWIIPRYASEKDEQIIKNWIGIGFSGLIMLIELIETKAENPAYLPIGFYLFVLAVCLSGTYWWIPTYIPEEQQSSTTTLLFMTLGLSIALTNALNASLNPVTRYPVVGARRR
jgi:F0F1-type ATP synthase membrane subunit a